MIYDSGVWKEELKTHTANFQELIKKADYPAEEWYNSDSGNGWTEGYKMFIAFQKYCFYSAVISRKFIESNRLSDELLSTNYSVSYFKKSNSKVLTKDNLESLDEEYLTDVRNQRNMTLDKICHLFIHSFVFSPVLKENIIDSSLPEDNADNWEVEGIEGLYINTDHSKDKEVLYLDLDQIFKIFTDVANDDVLYIYKNRLTNEVKQSRKFPKGHKPFV